VEKIGHKSAMGRSRTKTPRTRTSEGTSFSGHETAEALLDATERLLASNGYAALSTRRIAEEAGLAHGLIRYHFGSVEELMIRTVERASDRIVARQRELYAGNQPFLDKWRTAMELFETDLRGGFPKVFAELMAHAWNEPRLRPRMRKTMEAFADVLSEAAGDAVVELDLDPHEVEPVAMGALVRTFQLGMLLERLTGIDVGHAELLDFIDRTLSRRSNHINRSRKPGKRTHARKRTGSKRTRRS
jgi:AcrR family transcriptional regulator